MEPLARRIQVAQGIIPADLVLSGGRVANLFTGELEEASVAVCDGFVAGVGDYAEGDEVMDLGGLVVAPSFIDAHIHIESTLLDVPSFAAQVVPRGTGAVLADPHEIANVLGTRGVRHMLDAAKALPIDLFVMVPSCVPATSLETSGAILESAEIAEMLSWDGVVGLGEMMNFPGVLAAAPPVLEKIVAAGNRPVDGHAPGLVGRALNAYASAGMSSDHETVSREEGLEKLRRGIHLLIREGSSERNLSDLVPLVNDFTFPHTSLACDDRTALDLSVLGHVDHTVRRAVAEGVPPLRALAMATLNTARHFGLACKGAVAPGYHADLVCLGSPDRADARLVFHRGRLVARDGEPLFSPDTSPASSDVRDTVKVPELREELVKVKGGPGEVPLIEIVPGQIVTKRAWGKPRVEDGFLLSSPGEDVLKLVVVERHTGRGGHAAGFVRGLGLRAGAMASSVAHDSHNLIAAGVDDADILAALRAVVETGGGMAFVQGGEIRARLPLPVAGLMSDEPLDEVCRGIRRLREAARQSGSKLEAPFSTLSFLALPVIPEIRLTDRGLVDVLSQSFISGPGV
jgi:adenine deaminase